MVDNSKAQ